MTINPNNFDDVDTRERLYKAQRKYHKTVVRLFLATMLLVVCALSLIIYFEIQAAHGRDVISDCITPQGDCSKRSGAQGATLVSASTYCGLHLDRSATRDETLRCIKRFVMSEGR